MDIFSGIKNIQNNTYEKVDITYKNNNNTKHIQEVQKNMLEKKSKEDIKKEIQKIVEELNKAMNPLNTDLKFKFNDKVDELTVLVVDKTNDKVIREFPPKEALKLMEKMRELVGMLFDKKG